MAELKNDKALMSYVFVIAMMMMVARTQAIAEGTIAVYDCESPRTTLHAIDLTTPKACSITTSHYDEPKMLHAEVLEAVHH